MAISCSRVCSPLVPEVARRQRVYVPYLGIFREAVVDKVSPKIGRVFVTLELEGKERRLAGWLESEELPDDPPELSVSASLGFRLSKRQGNGDF